MASKLHEDASVLPNMMSVDGFWAGGTHAGSGVPAGVGEDRDAVRSFTARTRALVILNFLSRVALVGGVLTALEFAV